MIKGSKHSEVSRKLISKNSSHHVSWNKGKGGYTTKGKGRKHSKETKEKMSKTRIKLIQEGKIKLWNKGLNYKQLKPTSIKTKENISKRLTGRKLSKTHIENLKKSHKGQKAWNKGVVGLFTGEKSSNWKGGKTKIRLLIPSLAQYRAWRSKIFERDNWTCQTCHKRGCYLEAHHIKRLSVLIDQNNLKTSKDCISCDELWDISNGVTLCKDCHNLTKGWRSE